MNNDGASTGSGWHHRDPVADASLSDPTPRLGERALTEFRDHMEMIPASIWKTDVDAEVRATPTRITYWQRWIQELNLAGAKHLRYKIFD